VFDRPKKGFSLPLGDWMLGTLRDECEAAVDRVAACPLLDGTSVRRLWDEYRASPGTIHWTRPLSLVALGSYLQREHQSRA
jgi:hypothetical protein